jgi:lipopolysaccharide export system permease protein
MRQYERYLLMHLLLPTVLVTLSLTGIIWLTQVMRFIDFMLNRGLTISDFLYLTGLMLPSLLLILIPVAQGIAVIYTYNRLTADSELIVLNAVGLSRLQLVRPALAMGAVCTLICYALALYLMPVANQKFRDIRTFFRDKYASVLLEEEVFNTPIDGITVFVRERDSKNNLYGILLHDNRIPTAPVTMMAERGRMEQGVNGPRFYLENGVRQERKDGAVSWLSFDNYALDIGFFATDIQRKRDPDERGIGELLRGNPADEKENRALRAEAHQRLTWPLFAMVMPMLALAFLMAGEFNRRGQWKRMVQAAIALVATIMLFFALRNLIVKQPWLTPSLYLLVFGAMAFSVCLLARGRILPARPIPPQGVAA